MGLWKWIKKDVGYFKTIVHTERQFHQFLWLLVHDHAYWQDTKARRRPLSQLTDAVKSRRKKQEEKILTVLLLMWLALTVWLIQTENWQGFAVWLLFAVLVLRSIVIIRGLAPGKGLAPGLSSDSPFTGEK
ncbi:hypothetical protein HF670_03865 [Acidithiobacillus thiooxidans]|jgi:hypothetical protein|uniref:Uncharacterized protein n=1 Tax=Acidithiobacillus thiooxidans TaxID=930 RepID=A0A1C2J2D7_ACITH|nr:MULTISPECIES: hypothetical protein [Acidithiobacillus]MBU2741836.1 hypothetical protein [Acidithiobacillus albertensis]MBU2792442.1 hypothetical protein [Acidithiobacillus thiooxidans]MBU2838712.1 hypothetical protein [Acidithiobacillus thiooxidans]MBU2843227.1 hypothetical protein [Acidithiobacillus thiooxidans]OCX73541.1 hypothetical protein A6P07_08345 [Acidithiobacillus thiooxidans]